MPLAGAIALHIVRRFFARVRTASLASIIVAVGCSAPPTAEGESLGTTGEKIVFGTPSDASQNAVVLLEIVSKGYNCSGTLLAPNLVLTARHCVSGLTGDGQIECDAQGKGGASTTIGADFVPGTIFVYAGTNRPKYASNPDAKGAKLIYDVATNLCDHDIALILLDRPVPNAVISPVRLDGPPSVNDTITAVGWGVSDTADLPPVRLQRRGVRVTEVGPNNSTAVPTPPNYFQASESICEGDSGGPAYAESTGAVVGVVSFGGNGTVQTKSPASQCVNGAAPATNFFTRLDPFRQLILAAYQEAGQKPWIIGSAAASGQTGGGCTIADRASPHGASPDPTSAWWGGACAFIGLIARRRAGRRSRGRSSPR